MQNICFTGFAIAITTNYLYLRLATENKLNVWLEQTARRPTIHKSVKNRSHLDNEEFVCASVHGLRKCILLIAKSGCVYTQKSKDTGTATFISYCIELIS